MEQTLNLKTLGGIEDLRPFFGDIRIEKIGKHYIMVGDANLKHTEFSRFTKRPYFETMGSVIYAGLNRICRLTKQMPSDFAVRLLQRDPTNGVVNIEIIQGRGAVLEPNMMVPCIWIQYNLRSPKYVKYSLLMYRLQCSNGMMVMFDGFINERVRVKEINHIHHQWSPCFYNSLFYSFKDALELMQIRKIDRHRIAQTLMSAFQLNPKERQVEMRSSGGKVEYLAMELDKILADHTERYGETEYAMLQAATFFASHVVPEPEMGLTMDQQQLALTKYREKRMRQVGRLMTRLEKASRKYQPGKQLRNREWEELFNLSLGSGTW